MTHSYHLTVSVGQELACPGWVLGSGSLTRLGWAQLGKDHCSAHSCGCWQESTPRRLLDKSLLFSWLLTEGHPLCSLLHGAVLGAAHNMETVFIRESK